MYGWEKLVLFRHLLEEGIAKTAIAARLGVSRRLVYDWIRTGQLDVELTELTMPRVRVPRPAKIAPYEGIIRARLETYPELSAVRLLSECRAAGYQGGVTQLRALVARVRPREAPEPVVRFETPPGLQAQVDFAECRFPWGKRYALLVVLGYSRLLWVRFYPRQTLLTLMRGLEEMFAYIGGVPRELLFDQLKAVIVDDGRPHGGKLLENPEFLRFAAHWGFRIRACRPYRAKTKGKVERPIHYVRRNFLYGREFLADGDLDAQRLAWLEEVANVRVHGTTHESPRARFARDEGAVLQPLAPAPYAPLVLPFERVRAGRHTPLVASVPVVTVERRALAAYAALTAELP
jgi:transposase